MGTREVGFYDVLGLLWAAVMVILGDISTRLQAIHHMEQVLPCCADDVHNVQVTILDKLSIIIAPQCFLQSLSRLVK